MRLTFAVVVIAALLAGCASIGDSSDAPDLRVASESMEPTFAVGDGLHLQPVEARGDVDTRAEGGPAHFGALGDVIAFHPQGISTRTPIIHRAMAWVDVIGESSFTIAWDPAKPCPEGGTATESGTSCAFGADGMRAPELGFPTAYRPSASGFLTKGDNPETNARADQASGLSAPVSVEWILGKVVAVEKA